jgi:hypothetical protein
MERNKKTPGVFFKNATIDIKVTVEKIDIIGTYRWRLYFFWGWIDCFVNLY